MTIAFFKFTSGGFTIIEMDWGPINICLYVAKSWRFDYHFAADGFGFDFWFVSFDMFLDFYEDVGEDTQCIKCKRATLSGFRIKDQGPFCYDCFKGMKDEFGFE